MTSTKKMTEIAFTVPTADLPWINRILDRATTDGLLIQERVEHFMDLCATHANGCPMDFQRLAECDDYTFVHDFCGIFKHINRLTGQIENLFSPKTRARSASFEQIADAIAKAEGRS